MAIYNQFKSKLVDGSDVDLINDTIKVALLADTYVPDIDTQEFWSDVVAHEVSGSGYTAGGQTLSGKALAVDTVNDRSVFTADDVEWAGATLTARFLAVYKDTGVAGTSELLGYIQFATNQSVSGANFVIQWGSVGILTIS